MASSRSSAPSKPAAQRRSRSAAARRPADHRPPTKRYGSETPRIFTPPLRRLTPKTTAGYSCIEFAEDVLELTLLPWQKWLLLHALELLPDGTFRFRTVVVLVARQNGKSTLGQLLALWFMYARAARLVIGTAQNLDIAEEVWQGAVDIAEETEALSDQIDDVVTGAGKKVLILRSGERYRVQSANRRGGRGLSGDLILLDELREHQSWDSWSAVTKTTLARIFAQIWALSNAGDVASIVLRHLRKMAHRALGDPDGICAKDETPSLVLAEDRDDLDDDDLDEDSLGLFEWSAPPGCAIDDRDGWAQANPSLGHTITERAIASAMRTDPEWVFRTEVLCQWSDGTLVGPFPPGSWEGGTDATSKRAPGAELGVGIATSHDRTTTYVGVAGRRVDGKIHVGIVATRAGMDWVLPWLEETRDTDARPRWERLNVRAVTVQGKGTPASALRYPLEESDVPFQAWEGEALPNGTGEFYDFVRTGGVFHVPQTALDTAAATAVTKPLGERFAWNLVQSPADAAPLQAVTGATWALLHAQPAPAVSAYESSDFATV